MEEDIHVSDCGISTACQTKDQKQKVFKFLFFFLKELVDCILDWLLYNQLNAMEEGLVYGVVSNSILGPLFFFCCTGVVLAIMDVANRLCDIYTGKPFDRFGIIEGCVIFLEDIPQLYYGLVVLSCRSEEGLFAIMKAFILLFGSFVTFVYLGRECKNGDFEKSFCVLTMVFGTVIVSILSLIICIDSFQPNIQYFSNVGIYSDISDYQSSSNFFSDKTLMKFFEISDLQRRSEITTQVTTDSLHIRVQMFYTGSHINDTDICYRLNRTYMNHTKAADCTMLSGTRMHFHFVYLPPSKRYILGDIQYNARMTSTDSCDNITMTHVPQLSYYQENATQESTGHLRTLLMENQTFYYFYSAEENLANITDLWHTGRPVANILTMCRNTGRISPKFNPGISVPCRPDITSSQ